MAWKDKSDLAKANGDLTTADQPPHSHRIGAVGSPAGGKRAMMPQWTGT